MPFFRRGSLYAVALALAAVPGPRSSVARADTASAEAELPATKDPLLLVTTTSTTASKFEDLARRPEYAVYPDGTFIVQKTDGRLWVAVLSHAEIVEFLRFVLDEAKFASIDMSYLLSSPVTTFTQFSLTTRSGTVSARRRASGGFGKGVKDGERALGAVETKLIALSEKAQAIYTPGAIFVLARRISPSDATPTWADDSTIPFANFVSTADVERVAGVVFEDQEAETVRTALTTSPAWRMGALAAEFKFRPALPHERTAPPPIPPAPPTPPAPAVPATGEELPKPPTMPPTPTPPTPAPLAPLPPPPVVPAPPEPVPPTVAAPPTVPTPTPTASGEWRDDDLDFGGVAKVFADLKRKASGSPHGSFWTKPYEAFVDYEFEVMSGTGGRIKMIEKGDGKGSNLVKALRGQALTIRMADGTTRAEAFAVMPPKGAQVSDADFERIVRWIDHGAPKDRPAASAPREAPAPPAPPVVPPPAPVPSEPTPTPPLRTPVPAPASTPPAVASDWTDDDVDYAGVQKLFADLNRKTSGSPHGKFWTKTYEEFFAFEFDSDEGKVRMIEPGKGAESNLVRALDGRPLVVRDAAGTMKETAEGARMPPKGAPMEPADITKIRRWIDHGAPKERPASGATPATPSASTATQPASPVATPTGETRALTLVGTDEIKLGREAAADDGRAAPKLYAARNAAEWTAIFATELAGSGANGPRVAKALKLLEGMAKGYDFAASPLLLLVGPVTDNYAVSGTPTLELLSDGGARVVVRHSHEARVYAVAPELNVWWAIYRVAGTCPGPVGVSAPSR